VPSAHRQHGHAESRSATLTAYGFSTARLLVFGGDMYFESAALIIAFLALGRYFEARANVGPGNAIRALLELGAKTSQGAKRLARGDGAHRGGAVRSERGCLRCGDRHRWPTDGLRFAEGQRAPIERDYRMSHTWTGSCR